jgi:type I restriction enzyme R subunit
VKVKNDQISKMVDIYGLDEKLLRHFMESRVSDDNINEYGRFDRLVKSVDKAKAKAHFEKEEGTTITTFASNSRTFKTLKEFVLSGGFDV